MSDPLPWCWTSTRKKMFARRIQKELGIPYGQAQNLLSLYMEEATVNVEKHILSELLRSIRNHLGREKTNE